MDDTMEKRESARRSVGASISDEDRLLREIVRLLGGAIPLDGWPDAARDALAGAIAEGGRDATEDSKARRLADHLFLGLPGIPAVARFQRTRAAERIRADLADLVPYGAGLYLVDEAELTRMASR